MAAKRYWLLKSEPSDFSIDDLNKAKNKSTYWDGVRNYQARNTLRDDIKIGDGVLFYHSNAKPPCIVGVASVVKEGYPDHTQFELTNKHYDPKAREDNPRWFMVDIKFEEKFSTAISIDAIKAIPGLKDMVLLNNSRLSVQPVTKNEWDKILKMGRV
jgi:predicted RNA-binding protein with PUA-like domain